MKKIERPDWIELLTISREKSSCDCNGGPYKYIKSIDFNKLAAWFTDTIEPINKLIEDAKPVYGRDDGQSTLWTTITDRGCTHKALLIDVQPIEQESAEDVLHDFIKHGDRLHMDDKLFDRAKAALDRSKEGESE